MRICLLTGDGYPYRRSVLGDWCHTLVAELTEHTFELVTLVEGPRPVTPAYPRTRNVASARILSTGGPARRAAADATGAAVLMCRGLLVEQAYAHQTFTRGLRGLADVAAGTRGGPLDGVPLVDLIVQAWCAGTAGRAVDRLPLPRLSLRDARTAADLLRRALDGLATRLPAADLVHCVGGTAPLLAALAARWRTGTPLLLTGPLPPTGPYPPTAPSTVPDTVAEMVPDTMAEMMPDTMAEIAAETMAEMAAETVVEGVGPRERDVPLPVRTLMRRFRRAVLRAGCAEAGLVAPMSGHQRAWALRHDTPAPRLVTVPPGVPDSGHPDRHPGRHPGRDSTGGDDPVLVYAGGGPGGALALALECFARVLAAEPGTVLHATGIADERRAACAAQIARSGLGAAVRLAPGPDDPYPHGSVRRPHGPERGPGGYDVTDSGHGGPGVTDSGHSGHSGHGVTDSGHSATGGGHGRGGYGPGGGVPVVVHVPEPGEPPTRLIEAMMAGAAIVGAEVADVAETLGGAGVVVPGDDPAGLAAACVELLRRPGRRHALAAAARRRALARFTAAHLARGYDALYTDLAAPPPGPAYELPLALPAPRSPSSTAVFDTTSPRP